MTNTDATIGRVTKGYVSDFLDVTSGTFYSYVTTLVSNGITAGIGGGNYGVTDSTRAPADGGLPAESQARPLLHASPCAGTFTDVPCTSVVRALDRGPGGARHHRRLRREQLLSVEPGAPRPDGGLPAEDQVRLVPCPPGLRRRLPGRACSSPFAPWIEELEREHHRRLRRQRYCPDNPNTRGQMAVFIVKTFGLQ